MDGNGCPKPQPCTYTFPDTLNESHDLPLDFEPVEAGDLICGGRGSDWVNRMYGGTFVGGAGDDRVNDELFGGIFDGGEGDDRAQWISGGTFYGRAGHDEVPGRKGGTFDGGDDYDQVINFLGGVCSTTVEACGSEQSRRDKRPDPLWGGPLLALGAEPSRSTFRAPRHPTAG